MTVVTEVTVVTVVTVVKIVTLVTVVAVVTVVTEEKKKKLHKNIFFYLFSLKKWSPKKSTSQFVMKIKNSSCDETQKLNCDET